MARAGTVPRRSDLLHCRVSDLQGKPAKCQNRVNLPAGFTAAGETRDFTKQDYPDVSGNHCRLPAGFQGARFPEGRLIGGGAQIMLYTSKFCINSGHSLFRRRLRGPIRGSTINFFGTPHSQGPKIMCTIERLRYEVSFVSPSVLSGCGGLRRRKTRDLDGASVRAWFENIWIFKGF